MLARNPKTGATIKLLKSDSSIWKNQKTLVWMKSPPSNDANLWKRWDIVVEGVHSELLQWQPQIVVLLKDGPEVHAWLKTPEAKEVRFILISEAIVNSVGADTFHEIGLGNVLCLEEFKTMYPFLGSDWNGTTEDAILNAALVFRYQKLVGIGRQAAAKRLSDLLIHPVLLSTVETSNPPERLVLIQQYYKPLNATRAKELETCLIKNLENPLIDSLYLFVESKDLKLPKHPKLIPVFKKARITYADCIELILNRIGAGHLVAFANADIYMDQSWASLWSVDIHNVLCALLRWEEGQPPELFGPRSDSQDTWLLHSDSVLERKWQLEAFRIPFGKAGCDNAILVEFLRNKFRIVNPAMSLRTIHVHTSQVRTYDPQDIVDRPVYMHVDPSGIHELNPLPTWDGWTSGSVIPSLLHRPLKATTPKTLGIFCSQMNRDPAFLWSADGLNTYVAPADQEHVIDISGGAFVSPNGLVYRHTDLCVGKTEIQKTVWSDNKLSHLMPAQHTKAMMCFPLEEEWLSDPALYTLYYLSRVLKQHQTTPQASFWCKKTSQLLAPFRIFRWKEARGHLLQFNTKTQAFADKVVGRTAHTVRLTPSEIESLRTNLQFPWVSEPLSEEKAIVIVSDDLHIKDDLLNMLELFFQEKGYQVRGIRSDAEAPAWADALSGVSRVILSSSLKNIKGNSWAWMWLAPKGCSLLELQEEREPSDSLVHLAAAGNMEWTLLQYPRSTPEGFKKIIMKEVDKWLQMGTNGTQPLPLILLPPKSMKFGFFGHKGDSFRELIDMWSEKGYVEVREDPIITQCWLGGVGKTLLYDRPTWSWLEKASEAEQSYELCLAGNPPASEKPNAKPWIFWPRHPRLVENLSQTQRSYAERSDGLVFYGRVENPTQGAFRQDISGWQPICSKFSMPIGAKEPYMFTPEEYLLALQKAKYGLCLRGYGQKCNREIELLAMGTVPVVMADVDIEGYDEPLIEGIHVLRVASPAEAKKVLASTTEAQWTTMSKAGYLWWKRNASADGSWAKTKGAL